MNNGEKEKEKRENVMVVAVCRCLLRLAPILIISFFSLSYAFIFSLCLKFHWFDFSSVAVLRLQLGINARPLASPTKPEFTVRSFVRSLNSSFLLLCLEAVLPLLPLFLIHTRRSIGDEREFFFFLLLLSQSYLICLSCRRLFQCQSPSSTLPES